MVNDPLMNNFLVRFVNKKIKNYRDYEFPRALKYLDGCNSILDVGCGTGMFLDLLVRNGKKEVCGIDQNPQCIEICIKKGLNVRLGDALEIPYDDNQFDGVYLSHVLPAFNSQQAFKCIKELIRVVKLNGVIAIATVPMYERFFFDAADVRPYPPEAIREMFRKPKQHGHGAPTIYGLPTLTEEEIWMRRPALFEINLQGSHLLFNICQFLSRLQYQLLIRKYWTFNGYIIKFRNSKE